MTDAPNPNQATIQELKVTAHMMTLEPGVFCVFQTPSHQVLDASGLPGVRLSPPPGMPATDLPVDIVGFRGDGWIGEFNDALLVRVRQTAQVMVTIYQSTGDRAHPPNLQVVRVGNVPQGQAAAIRPQAQVPAVVPEDAELSAHIQARGDVGGMRGDWLGEPGSGRWIEGYLVKPPEGIAAEDLEYQSVLGRGWMSPWVAAGEFCGSRGMALPVLGLRLRLRGAAEEGWTLSVEASFTDGTKSGPVGSGELLESPALAPLEAFLLRLEPKAAKQKAPEPARKPLRAQPEERVAARPRAARSRGR